MFWVSMEIDSYQVHFRLYGLQADAPFTSRGAKQLEPVWQLSGQKQAKHMDYENHRGFKIFLKTRLPLVSFFKF